MRILVSEKLSPHKMKTPEGYLICTDAILSRTGKQTYRRSELWGDACDNAEKEVEVDRKAEEVFSDKTLASFENKPICIEHPDEDVNVNNHNQLSVGFVRDIKRGKVDGQDVMLGTLVITDADAVEAIERGDYTELSCGYNCDIVDEDNPQQRNIRGNHVALCEHGRAGIARIVDSVDDARFWGQQYPYELWLTYPKTGRKFMAGAFKTHEEARRNTDRLRKEFTHNVDGIPNAEIRENFRDSVDDAGIKVWQVRQGYAIVVKRYWQQYGKNAFVDATESSIEAARYHRGSLERNDKMEFVIIDCNDGKYKIEDSEMKDIQATKTPGTDKIIYVMQSDVDKNLYFYIGKTFSMKEGAWGYTKFEMGTTTPEQLKAELTRNGWHQVPHGAASIIDASNEEWAVVEEENYKKANEAPLKKDYDYSKETDKEFLKSAIKEMQRYESTWSFMTKQEKQDIAPGGIKELRASIASAKKRLSMLDSINTKDKQIVRSSSNEIHVFKARGKYEVDAYNRNNLDYNALRQIENKFNVNLRRGDYGYITIISANKDAIYKAFAAINPAYGVGSWRIEDSVAKDSKEQLFTIEYKQGDTTYIRKVRANSIEDAISKVKDNAHKVVVFTNEALRELGKNNSIGKYDRVVQAMRSLYSETLLPDDELKEKIRQTLPRLIAKYVKE